jgi:hypothetical protein
MNKRIVLAVVIALGVAAVVIVLTRPPRPVDEFYSAQEWRQLFDSAGGWIVLSLPDSKYEPGAIIQVSRESGVRFLSHLRTCRYPDRLLAPIPGNLPALEFRKYKKFSAQLLAGVQGLEVGPEGGSVASVGLKIDSMTAESFDFLALAVWEDEDDNDLKVAEACRKLLNEKDKFVIAEAARVGRATYTLYDSANARIGLTAENVGGFLRLASDVNAQTLSDGRLSITQPVTVAVRRAIWAGQGFEVLGPGEAQRPSHADALMDSVYVEEGGL